MNRAKDILEKIVLTEFNRTKSGKIQYFYFTFKMNEKEHTLEHSFLYHGNGVENWFKFKKSFFEPKPFKLTNEELTWLSGELMKTVNKWNRSKEENIEK